MLWHVDCKPTVGYEKREAIVDGQSLESEIRVIDETVHVTSIGVKKVCKLLNKTSQVVKIFHVRALETSQTPIEEKTLFENYSGRL